ncbi:MAG: hypothetical protein ABSC49_02945 [Candidatus Microgenomates bacterium]|jgi:hypothetical protein
MKEKCGELIEQNGGFYCGKLGRSLTLIERAQKYPLIAPDCPFREQMPGHSCIPLLEEQELEFVPGQTCTTCPSKDIYSSNIKEIMASADPKTYNVNFVCGTCGQEWTVPYERVKIS